MINFDAELDDRAARDVGRAMRGTAQAAASSVNDTARYVRVRAVTRITDRLNLRRDYADSKFSIRRASPANATAYVDAVDTPVQIRQYAARQEYAGSKRAGVSVEVLRGGPRKTLKTAFFGPLRSGAGTGVFMRKGAQRRPLRVVYAPSPGQMFNTISGEMSEEAMRHLLADTFARFDTQIGAT